MAQQTKSTHRAHCQVCGRIQALIPSTGRLAKHGYKVHGWGYFVGTCTGSDRLPMQKERYYTDQICTALTQHAEEMDRVAEAYRTGAQVPKTAQTRVAGKKDYVHIAWADATELQRRDTVRALVWSCEGKARRGAVRLRRGVLRRQVQDEVRGGTQGVRNCGLAHTFALVGASMFVHYSLIGSKETDMGVLIGFTIVAVAVLMTRCISKAMGWR